VPRPFSSPVPGPTAAKSVSPPQPVVPGPTAVKRFSPPQPVVATSPPSPSDNLSDDSEEDAVSMYIRTFESDCVKGLKFAWRFPMPIEGVPNNKTRLNFIKAVVKIERARLAQKFRGVAVVCSGIRCMLHVIICCKRLPCMLLLCICVANAYLASCLQLAVPASQTCTLYFLQRHELSKW
jgi:hypothetical protein